LCLLVSRKQRQKRPPACSERGGRCPRSQCVGKQILHGSAAFDEAELDTARYPGELLPDWYDDWVHLEREQLRELRLHALETLGDRLMSYGRYGEAVEAALPVLRLEPLHDSAHRLLIRIHLAEGNNAEALRQYNGYRRRLLETLRLEPSHQMDELVRDVTVAEV